MAQDIPHFGFETTPDISAAEREAVSTRPDSALQRAIRSTQQSEEFYTPGELLMMGPQAFNVAREAELGRRKMLVGRAQQGINLSNLAISHRGTQRGHDARRAQEIQARGFMERTRGMDPDDVLAEVTPEEASNKIIMDSIIKPLDVLDIQRTSRMQREEQRRGLRARGTVPMEQLEKNAMADAQVKGLQLEATLEKLLTEDLSNPDTAKKILVDGGVRDVDAIIGLSRMLEEDPDRVKPLLSILRDTNKSINMAASYDFRGATKAREDVAKALVHISQGGELSEKDKLAIMMHGKGADDLVAKAAARKVELRETYEELRNAVSLASGMTYKDWLTRYTSLLSTWNALNKEKTRTEKADPAGVTDEKERKAFVKRLIDQGWDPGPDGKFTRETVDPSVQAQLNSLSEIIADFEKKKPGDRISAEDQENLSNAVKPPGEEGASESSADGSGTNSPLDEIPVELPNFQG